LIQSTHVTHGRTDRRSGLDARIVPPLTGGDPWMTLGLMGLRRWHCW